MKQYIINENLKNDIVLYIDGSNSRFNNNEIAALRQLISDLVELPQIEVTPTPLSVEEQLAEEVESTTSESDQQEG